jgi:two-component sensor histidine kinase
VNERPAPDDELLYLGSLAELVTSLTGRFVHFAPGELDAEIDRTLRLIGQFAAVDRSYVFRFSPDRARLTNTHEWCGGGVEPAMARIQEVEISAFAWALQPLLAGEVLYVEEVAALPDEIGEVKREFQRQGIRSLLNVPLMCSGEVLGFVGFDAVKQAKRWGSRDIRLLRVVGEIIANAMEREAAAARLTYRVALETLVASISSRFINIAGAEVDAEIARAIAEIGAFTRVDRSYVFRFSHEGTRLQNTEEWCADGIEPQIGVLADIPAAPFGYSLSVMEKGEVFYVEDVAALPQAAAAERVEFEREGIKTLINVPIMVRGRMTGFLGFDAVRARRVWSADDGRLLKLVGEIFANALQRRDAEDRLRASLKEKELLLREIHHRVKNNLQVVDSLLYLQGRAAAGADAAPLRAALAQSQGRIRAMAKIHELLYRSHDIGRLMFCEYLEELAGLFRGSTMVPFGVELTVCGCRTVLDLDRAIPCGLIVNELVTNSMIHGYPDGGPGRIAICVKEGLEGRYALTVEDDGIGFAGDFAGAPAKTLGLRLVRDLSRQLGGEMRIGRPAVGTRVEVLF